VQVRLLVVDDETRFARALQYGLEAEGFVVDVAHTGPEGLEMARDRCHDAILLDLMLPGMSGYQILRQLRTEEIWTPVLMLTAKDGEHDEVDALDEGADDYLTKPFSFVVLLARIRALVRRGVVARPQILRGGSVEIDPAARRVRLDGVEIDVSPREFALLEYLWRRPGQAVSKTELYEHVWGGWADHQMDLNVVEVYVGYVRRKLGREVIETVRGAGYRAPERQV
jgi:two-component system OmpR family response regulator